MKYQIEMSDVVYELPNGLSANTTATINFQNDEGEVTRSKTLGYLDKDTILQLKKTNPSFILEGLYFKDFSIHDYKELFTWEDHILVDFKAENCFFDGNSDFSRVIYGKDGFNLGQIYFGEGKVDFQNAEFYADVINFHNIQFCDGTKDFSYTVFHGNEVNFFGTEFKSGLVDFKASSFAAARLNFSGAIFEHGDLNFDYSVFSSLGLDFSGVNFGDGAVSFRNSNFNSGNIIFFGSTFGKGKMSFSGSSIGDGDIDFSLSHYEDCAITFKYTVFGTGHVNMNSMALDEGIVYFKSNEFKGKVINFSDSSFKNLSFTNCMFVEHVNMSVAYCGLLTLDNCIIEKTFSLAPSKGKVVDIKSMNLLYTKNLGQIDIDWTINNVKDLIYSQKETSNYREKANQFRILKENFRNIGQYNDEDYAYVEFKRCENMSKIKDPVLGKEKHPKLSKIKRYIIFPFEWFVLDFIGNYATNPFRIIGAMFVTIFVFFAIYTMPFVVLSGEKALFTAVDSPMLQTFSKAIYHSVATIFTIGYGDVNPGNIAAMILSGFEGFIGLFLMSYFTVAFVRKILR